MSRAALRRLPVRVVLAVALVATLSSCREGTVRLTFRPEVGATYRYELEVRTVSEVRIGPTGPERREEDVTLTAEHTVLRSGDDGVEVRVLLQEPGSDDRVFEVVFDRAAQLEEVRSIEGVPDERLGLLGIAEIFPAAVGAPPDRALAPGAGWVIDDPVQVPDSTSKTRLDGSGRLVELGVVDGEKVASLEAAARLPLEAVIPSASGELRLEGVQVTDYRATHDLDDGSVREASSTTLGRFDLEVSPPPDRKVAPVPGFLVVQVSSRIRLLPPAAAES